MELYPSQEQERERGIKSNFFFFLKENGKQAVNNEKLLTELSEVKIPEKKFTRKLFEPVWDKHNKSLFQITYQNTSNTVLHSEQPVELRF